MAQFAMSQFASTPGILPGRSLSYMPKTQQEAQCYETLWTAVNPSGAPTITGAQAVPFFQRSGLEITVLKNVWSLSTPSSSMSKEQFFTSMRLISIAQRGEIATAEKLLQYDNTALPPPAIQGVQLPQLSGGLGTMPGSAYGPMMAAGASPVSYAFGEGDVQKYQALFGQYDADHDGFITGAEAVKLFSQSGLSREVLRDVWNLADQDQDSKLNPKEFAVAFHLIVCASKRNMPMPKVLPAPLKEYVSGTPSSTPVPGMGVMGAIPNTRRLSGTGSSLNIGNLLGPPEPAPAPAPVDTSSRPTSASAHGTPGEPRELGAVAHEIATQARRALDASSSVSESQAMAYSTLSELLQKLKAEKVALNASIQASVGDSEEIAEKLKRTAVEIDGLRRELDGMKTKYRELQNVVTEQSRDIGAAEKEREMLVREIDICRRQMEAIQNDRAVLLTKTAELNGRAQQLEEHGQLLDGAASLNRQEVAHARNDVLMMRSLLSVFTEHRNAAVGDVQGLQAQLRDARTRLEKAEEDVNRKNSEIDKLRSERESLLQEKKQLADQIGILTPASPALSPIPKTTSTAPKVQAASALSVTAEAKPVPKQPAEVPKNTPAAIKPELPAVQASAPAPPLPTAPGDASHTLVKPVEKAAPTPPLFDASSPATGSAAFEGFGPLPPTASTEGFPSFDAFTSFPVAPGESAAGADGFGGFGNASAGFGDSNAEFGADAFGSFGEFGVNNLGGSSSGTEPSGFDAFSSNFGEFK